MGYCEFIETCQYFSDQIERFQLAGAGYGSHQMERIKALARRYNLEFCTSNCAYCARYMLAKQAGMDSVPADLHPSHVLRARQLIQRQRQTNNAAPKPSPAVLTQTPVASAQTG